MGLGLRVRDGAMGQGRGCGSEKGTWGWAEAVGTGPWRRDRAVGPDLRGWAEGRGGRPGRWGSRGSVPLGSPWGRGRTGTELTIETPGRDGAERSGAARGAHAQTRREGAGKRTAQAREVDAGAEPLHRPRGRGARTRGPAGRLRACAPPPPAASGPVPAPPLALPRGGRSFVN